MAADGVGHCSRRAAAAHVAFAAWMRDHALPFWARVGQDRSGLGFVEHLTLDARPASVAYKRARVQTRQIYVYSAAALNGVDGALAAAENGYSFLTRHGWNADGGFARRLGRAGGIVDPVVDLYENAFVLFAMAWYARATGNREPIAWAHRTLDWIETHMRTDCAEGFENAVPIEAGPRQQNPHMHLLEAALALHETTGEARFAATARDLLGLFRRRLFDSRTGTLAECFASDWACLDTPQGRRIEPGHHFEWVWLLDAVQRQLKEETGGQMDALYDFATRHGTLAETGWVVDSVDIYGKPLETSGRIWPQTEAIKAHCVMARRGVPQAAAEASRLVELLLSRFFARSPAGTWHEHLAPDGRPLGERIPATSLYHIATALGELTRTIGSDGRQAP
jgi:mannose/cellobiose epimerase-like protein (N-acyl-D-glucosamine 2-epimerase family)